MESVPRCHHRLHATGISYGSLHCCTCGSDVYDEDDDDDVDDAWRRSVGFEVEASELDLRIHRR